MAALLGVMLAFPSVIFTVLLGVVLLYWLFVLSGALHIDVLGGSAADGALEGAGHAAFEGVAKGALDGAADSAFDGAAESALHGGAETALHGAADAGGEGATDGVIDGNDGGLAGVVAALKLRSAPATVVLSLLITFSWLFSVLAMQGVSAWLPAFWARVASFAVLLLAPILALPVTSILVRPLGRFFLPKRVAAHGDLVGKTCVIRTGEVTQTFGEATLEDGGAGLVVRVRVDDSSEKLARGDQALIIDYDPEKSEFTVVPANDLQPPSRKARH